MFLQKLKVLNIYLLPVNHKNHFPQMNNKTNESFSVSTVISKSPLMCFFITPHYPLSSCYLQPKLDVNKDNLELNACPNNLTSIADLRLSAKRRWNSRKSEKLLANKVAEFATIHRPWKWWRGSSRKHFEDSAFPFMLPFRTCFIFP